MAGVVLSVSERIARLFAEGQPISAVIARGLAGNAWSRADVETELTARGWRLDATGRVPRQLRPAVPRPGVPLPRSGSGLSLVPSQGGWPDTARTTARATARTTPGAVSARPEPAHPRPASPPVQAAPRVNAPAPVTALPARPGPAGPAAIPTDPAALLALAASSPVRGVRGRTTKITALLGEVHALLTAAATTAAADAARAAERKRATDRLAALEAEAAQLRAELGGGRVQKRSRPRAADDSDIDHGSLSGFLKEVRRGLPACPACSVARDAHFTRMRERRWSRRTADPAAPSS